MAIHYSRRALWCEKMAACTNERTSLDWSRLKKDKKSFFFSSPINGEPFGSTDKSVACMRLCGRISLRTSCCKRWHGALWSRTERPLFFVMSLRIFVAAIIASNSCVRGTAKSRRIIPGGHILFFVGAFVCLKGAAVLHCEKKGATVLLRPLWNKTGPLHEETKLAPLMIQNFAAVSSSLNFAFGNQPDQFGTSVKKKKEERSRLHFTTLL